MRDSLSQRLSLLYTSNKLPWIIIGIGIILRIIRYLYNPSLWFDESDIAIDIIRRPIFELFYPSPDYNQAYPFGFLMLIKIATLIFKNSEYAIRLFPLLFGIISMFLFYRVARYYIRPEAVPLALGLFAILDPLIFESSNLKPYSGDIFYTLLIYLLAAYIHSRKLNLPRIVLFGVCGAIILWFSNPSVFVLTGIGACMAVLSLRNKEWSKTWKLSIAYLIWALSFIVNYFSYIQKLQASFPMDFKELLAVMEDATMPILPKSISDIKWFIDLFFEIFNYPVGMTLTGISALAFLIGCIFIYRQSKIKFIMLISPLVITFIAAALHQYPFKSRFIFFLVPLILLFIAEGTEYIREKISDNSAVPGLIFVGLLFLHPLLWAVYHIKAPSSTEEIRPVMNYIKNHWQKGDIIYVHYYAQYTFEYYTRFHPDRYVFDEGEYIIGIAPRGWYRHWRKKEVSKYYDSRAPIKQSSVEIFKIYAKDLERLKGNKRVWVLFTGTIPKDGIIEEKFFVYYLKTMGKQLDFFGRPGVSSVYLYDLSGETSNSFS